MINVGDVVKVYSGKSGCMCGCRGKYSYRSDWAEQGGKERGYAVDASEVSDRSVKIIVGKLNRNPNTQTKDGVAWLVVDNRSYAAYFG